MKVYFINLDRSPERMKWFQGQAERLGVEAVRVPAVDANQMDTSELDRWRALSSGLNSLSAGEIGCFLSHRKIWQAVLEGEDEWAFASEDDLHFTDDAARFINMSGWIPATAELVKAETNLRQEVELSFDPVATPFNHNLRQLRSTHYGSGGYFISKKAAAYLLEFTKNRCEPLDLILFSPIFGVLDRLQVLQISPAICLQDVFVAEHAMSGALASVITDERWEFHRANPTHTFGGAKITRELKRIGQQVARPFRKVGLKLMHRASFEIVPVAKFQSGVIPTASKSQQALSRL